MLVIKIEARGELESNVYQAIKLARRLAGMDCYGGFSDPDVLIQFEHAGNLHEVGRGLSNYSAETEVKLYLGRFNDRSTTDK